MVRDLEVSQKIKIYHKLAFFFIKMLNEDDNLAGKIEDLKILKGKLDGSMKFRNIVAHAKWDTVDEEGFVRVNVSVNKVTGFTEFKKRQITPDILNVETENLLKLEDEISEFWEIVQQIDTNRRNSISSDQE